MVEGIDVSKWQGVMSWATAAQRAKFAFVRAGSINAITGEPYADYQFVNNQAAANYIPVGWYWYWRPAQDPIVQAKYFSDLIRTIPWQLPPVIDVEVSEGVDATVIADRLYTTIKRIEVELEVKPIIYTRTSFWNIALPTRNWYQEYNLWIARYRSNLLDKPDLLGPWADGKFKIRDWEAWRFWQWQADGNGKGSMYGADSADIDLNVFNGTEYEFQQYVGLPTSSLEQRVDLLEDQVIDQQHQLDDIANWIRSFPGADG